MKIFYIHNDYHQLSGEEHASKEIATMLESHGHKVCWFSRSSVGIGNNIGVKIKAFFAGIYNPFIKRDINKYLDEYTPDVCIIQNIYPFISSAVFEPIKQRHIPIVMRCPNYRLFCPSGLCLGRKGDVCEKCWGKGHEWHCVMNNCECSLSKSIGYAIRNAFNRITGKIRKNVDCFIVQSEFQKRKFVEQGIPEDHIGILSGILPEIGDVTDRELGNWVTFVGRVSVEKGIDEFVNAARGLPKILFKVAGKIDENYHIPSDLPSNIEFVGFKKNQELNELYLNSRIVVVPSKWYEGFPNVILHAMLLKRPVITTRIGAMMNIIEDKKNGLLVNPADSENLRQMVSDLYYDIEACKKYGQAGHEKVNKVYSREQIYSDLNNIFQIAINNNKDA